MITKKLNIKDRIPIWVGLSEFYLDTELEDDDIRNIALKIAQSPYSLEEVKKINKYEVFPVLQLNLLSIAGEWAGFNEEWLESKIKKSLDRRNKFNSVLIEVLFVVFKWTFNRHIKKLEKIYKEIYFK